MVVTMDSKSGIVLGVFGAGYPDAAEIQRRRERKAQQEREANRVTPTKATVLKWAREAGLV